ncbi:MAG: hypothetical protein ACD_39C00382G0002 [uncultured bacterium]|nr:MAG: hypothetical protein ACD_39C00382G0002 [uncultured bacterium]
MKIINRILFVSLLAGIIMSTGCGDTAAPQAQPNQPAAVESADVKPAEVKTETGGSNVSLPGGIQINTGEGGTKVNLPGIEVKTEGDKSTVNMPGITVTSDGANSNVDMGGVKVNTDGTNSNVTVGDMKIDVKDGESNIQVPATATATGN